MDEMSVPWIPYLALRFLEVFIQHGWHVFEWGSGGSSRYWINRGCKLWSVEHDSEWYEKLSSDISDACVYILREPELGAIGTQKADPSHYYSACIGNFSFKEYARVIDSFGSFDLVMVDGRARPSCIAHAVSHVADGGFLLVDNTERPYYLEETLHLLEGWERATFYGHGPRNVWPWECSIFRKVEIN